MGVVLFFGILGSLLIPLLLSALIADLTVWKSIMLAAVATVVGAYFFVSNSDVVQRLYWRWTLPAFAPDETSFVAVADKLRVLRAEPAAQAGRDAALRQTEARLCALPVVADNWIGKVEQTYLVSTGQGASLTIGIWPHLVVRTALLPDGTGTLIRAGSPPFALVSNLQQGDVVRFSGRIIGRAAACAGDLPVDPNFAQHDPEFLMRFADVASQAAH